MNKIIIAFMFLVGSMGIAVADAPSDYTGIFSERFGFGKDATGGAAGTVCHVKTLASEGAGSLKECLGTGNVWIRFDVTGNLKTNQTLYPKSNTTIDCRDSGVNIQGDSSHDTTPFKLEGITNFIMLYCKMDDEWPNYNSDSEGSDGIAIKNSSVIWLHHLDMARWRDGDIDMRALDQKSGDSVTPDVKYVTVSFSRFTKTYQALNWTVTRLTSAYNYCDVKVRCHKIIGGKVHQYNNYIRNWNNSSILNASGGAHYYSEYNIFEPGSYNVAGNVSSSKLQQKNNYVTKTVQFIQSGTVNSDFLNEARAVATNMTKCGSTDKTCWAKLIDKLKNHTGITP